MISTPEDLISKASSKRLIVRPRRRLAWFLFPLLIISSRGILMKWPTRCAAGSLLAIRIGNCSRLRTEVIGRENLAVVARRSRGGLVGSWEVAELRRVGEAKQAPASLHCGRCPLPIPPWARYREYPRGLL